MSAKLGTVGQVFYLGDEQESVSFEVVPTSGVLISEGGEYYDTCNQEPPEDLVSVSEARQIWLSLREEGWPVWD